MSRSEAVYESPRGRAMTVDEQADIPFRFIEAASNGGKVPERSAYSMRKAQQEGAPAQTLTLDAPAETTARAGDSYWSIAREAARSITGRTPFNHETRDIVRAMAELNGKTAEQANHLKVGEKVKLPAMRRPVSW